MSNPWILFLCLLFWAILDKISYPWFYHFAWVNELADYMKNKIAQRVIFKNWIDVLIYFLFDTY